MPLSIIALAASVVVLTQAVPQQPESPPAPLRGTAIVRGQVTDRETGMPMARAAVTLRLSVASGGPVFQNLTDTEGRFEFTHLPAGSYQVSATAGEHRASHVREMHNPLPGGGWRSLMLKDGEVRADVNFSLRRSMAITGRVVDEFGDPLANVRIRVSPAGPGTTYFGSSTATDDRGLFRVGGRAPGQYLLCAEAERMGRYSNLTSTRKERWVTTCHPSAPGEAQAQAVTVASTDVDGIEIRMRRSRTFTISGSVVDSNGLPVDSVMVMFTRFERNGGSSGTSQSSDGRFRFTDVVPGEYAVEASVGIRSFDAADRRPAERGSVSLKIDEHDMTDVVVMMKKPATVQGRIAFEDAPSAGRDFASLEVTATREARSFSPSLRPGRVTEDMSFTLSDVFDPVHLALQGLPRGWAVKSIRYKGEEITHRATEFVTDPRHQIEIVLTSRLAVVSGSVTDDTGKPAAGTIVVLTPVDAVSSTFTQWRPTTRPTLKSGMFEMPGVPAGDYYVVAVPSAYYDSLRRERAAWQPLLKHAERITLVENDRLKLSLRLVTPPDAR